MTCNILTDNSGKVVAVACSKNKKQKEQLICNICKSWLFYDKEENIWHCDNCGNEYE